MTINKKLNEILKNQKKIIRVQDDLVEREKDIQKSEDNIEKIESKILEEEMNEEDLMKDLESIDKKINKKLNNSIKKITKRDFFKGFIGAFVGVVGHFAFSKAVSVSENLTFWKSTVLYIIAFMIIVMMLYYTGFRKLEKHIVLKFMPLRAIILYSVSVFTVLFVYAIFGKLHFPLHFLEVYNLVGASIILAAMGAGTADLIGGSE